MRQADKSRTDVSRIRGLPAMVAAEARRRANAMRARTAEQDGGSDGRSQ